MKHIRRWVYRLGFRPKYGTLFYSPSIEMHIVMRLATESFVNALKGKENKNG